MEEKIEGPLKVLEYHSTIVLKGLRQALNFASTTVSRALGAFSSCLVLSMTFGHDASFGLSENCSPDKICCTHIRAKYHAVMLMIRYVVLIFEQNIMPSC